MKIGSKKIIAHLSFVFLGNLAFSQERSCIFSEPLAHDKYTQFDYVFDRPNFTHLREKISRPNAEQLRNTMAKIYAHVAEENNIFPEEKRNVGESYCLFHSADSPVMGTVLLFHGFSNKPEQMSKLAAYLFNSGFNIYNVFLSQHYKVPAKKFWPKLRYRDGHPSVSKETILEAYKNPESDLFKQIFTEETAAPWEQNHNGWLHDAKRRLEELNDLGGRVYVVGLSLGAEVALRLGAEDGGNRIQAVVAHGPYLQAKNPEKRDQIKLAGPFDNQTARINDLEFSVATVAAQHALGASLFLEKNLKNLSKINTWLVGTESDNSADTGESYRLHDELFKLPQDTNEIHKWFTYSTSAAVGHALTDPRDYPGDIPPEQGGGRNYRYKALYQETLDFMVNQFVDENNLYQYGQRPDLPEVKPIFDNY